MWLCFRLSAIVLNLLCFMLSVIMLDVVMLYAECHNAEHHGAIIADKALLKHLMVLTF